MTKTQPWVIHPFVLAAFPTLYLFSHNVKTVDVSEVPLPLGISLIATALGFAILRAIRLDGPRAGLVVSAFLVLFFSFSHGVRLCERLKVGADRAVREGVVLAIEGAALTSVVGLVVKKPAFARGVNDACNASSIALAGMTAVGIVASGWSEPAPGGSSIAEPVAIVPAPKPAMGRLPDVYVVILDAYGRSDVLKEMYGFDNSDFLDRLERKGFIVARSSWANYCQTALSLAATLNLRYLDEFAGDPTHDRRPLRRLIADNPVFRAFGERGYRLVTFASGFDATESFDADLTLAPPGNLRTFQSLMADQTPLWLLLGQRSWREPHRLHRARSLKVFDELAASSHPSDAPTLTFAHVVAPHPPFVFGADGRDVSAGEAIYSLGDSEVWCGLPGHDGPDDYAMRYRDQVAYVTDRVERAVERILATSAMPPIILIQGDHGPGSHFDSASDRPNDLGERFGILNACYLPEGGRGRIGQGITPINTMRAVVDECLGTKLGPIEDRSFYSSYARPYDFAEVTVMLK
jgi:hypothetical protein